LRWADRIRPKVNQSQFGNSSGECRVIEAIRANALPTNSQKNAQVIKKRAGNFRDSSISAITAFSPANCRGCVLKIEVKALTDIILVRGFIGIYFRLLNGKLVRHYAFR